MFRLILSLTCLAAALAAPGDFRNEFDRLLVETSNAQNSQLTHRLLELQSEINHLTAGPTVAEQTKIVREIETMIAVAVNTEFLLTNKLKISDLNLVEKYEFETAQKGAQTLIKDLREAEQKVKAVKIATPTTKKPATPVVQHPLHITVDDFRTMENRLMALQTEINQLEVTKSKTEQAKIVKEIEDDITYVNTYLPRIKEELKKKDLSLQDQMMLELGDKLGQILVKDLKEAEVKVKAVQAH